MKQLLLFLFLASSVTAQDFSLIDQKVRSYPRYTSPEQLASRISLDFVDGTSKVRAIFIWLTQNIRYNLEEYYQPKRVIQFQYTTEEERLEKLQAIKDKIVKDAFLTKMGVCEEYAQSFKKVSDLLGIEAQVIKGYVRNSARDIGNIPSTTNHAWNAVKINDRWILLDATWAAGYLFNGKWEKSYNEYFFAIDPKKIGRTHFPNDKKWQILLNQRSLEDFYNQPIFSHRFLKSDLELLNANEGKIYLSKSKSLVLKIRNLPTNIPLFYNYQGQRYSEKAKVTYDDNTATVTIQNPGRNSELYIFLNRSLALEYKVWIQ